MRTLLKDYLVLVAQMEHQFKQGSLTLQRMWFYLQPCIHTLEVVGSIARNISAVRCCAYRATRRPAHPATHCGEPAIDLAPLTTCDLRSLGGVPRRGRPHPAAREAAGEPGRHIRGGAVPEAGRGRVRPVF